LAFDLELCSSIHPSIVWWNHHLSRGCLLYRTSVYSYRRNQLLQLFGAECILHMEFCSLEAPIKLLRNCKHQRKNPFTTSSWLKEPSTDRFLFFLGFSSSIFFCVLKAQSRKAWLSNLNPIKRLNSSGLDGGYFSYCANKPYLWRCHRQFIKSNFLWIVFSFYGLGQRDFHSPGIMWLIDIYLWLYIFPCTKRYWDV